MKNLLVCARFLSAELIAWKAENREAPRLVVLVEGTQTCVLRGKPSSTRHIDYETNLILKLLEVDLVTENGCHC